MPIHSKLIKDIVLNTDVVVSVDVISQVLPDSKALVESRGIYAAMQALSADLVLLPAADPINDVKLFNFSESPNVQVEDIPDTRNLISAVGPDMSTVYLVAGYDEGSLYFRIPSIIKLNSGRRIAIYDIRWKSHEDIGKTSYNDQCIGMSYSDDCGKTWTKPKAIIDWFYPSYDPDTIGKNYLCGASDPGILYDEENNVIMVFALGGYGYVNRQSQITTDVLAAERQQLVLSWSKDDGHTWSTPMTLNDKIFDYDGINKTWAQEFAYLFPTCTAGITLHRLPNADNNGMVFPVQVCAHGLTSNTWFKDTRIGILKVMPTYNSNRELIDIKLVFTGKDGANELFGEYCNGANECSICEGPNGEIAMAARAYRWISNAEKGTFTTSAVSIRVAKADALGAGWSLVGDIETEVDGIIDKACSSLETALQTKPGLFWSNKMRMYVIGYVQALNNGGNIRTNLVLRCSSDLVIWNYLTKLEFKQGMGYITFVPQEDANKFIECIYEAWNDGINSNSSISGSSKLLKYFSLAVNGNMKDRFSSTSLDLGAINSSRSDILGFAFKLSEATSTGPLSPMPLLAKPVAKIRIFWGEFTPSLSNIYAVIYDANSSDGKPVAYSDLMNLTESQNVFVEFPLKQAINIDTDHEYFVMFKNATATSPYPESLADIPVRGALGSGGNLVRVTTFCSKNLKDDYMKVYQGGTAKYSNSNPWFIYVDFMTT